MLRSKHIAVAALVLALAGLAGCGDDGGSESKPAANEITEATIGLVPISAVAPVYIGIDRGYFKAEGIDLQVKASEGGAALLPSVLKGEYEFGFSNPVSLIIASTKGLPIEIVANANSESKTADDDIVNSFVFAKRGSARDLDGKTIAVNTLDNLGPVTIRAALEKRGVDTANVKFFEVPFPEMIPALEAGRVDAVWLVEPFTSQAKKAGHRLLVRPYFETEPGMTTSVYFTSRRLAEEKPELVDGFVRAMQRSNAFAAEHPEALRAAVGKVTEIPPDVLKRIALPNPSPDLNVPSLQRLAKLMVRFDFADKEPDFGTLVRAGG